MIERFVGVASTLVVSCGIRHTDACAGARIRSASPRYRTAHHATVPSDAGWYQYDTIDPEGALMPNVLVRDLDDDVLKQLKASAKAHGRSLQAEIHEVLRNASARRMAETRRLSARWLRRLRGTTQTDSTALIREDRDTR